MRVTLSEVAPRVWRRVHVPSSMTLADLHHVVQIAMGWEDFHLHRWGIGYEEYGHDGRGEDIALEAVLGAGGRAGYIYDFGDDWHHVVEVERIHAPHPRTTYPRCSAGAQACPPEDTGGPEGYAELRRVLRHRKGWKYHRARELLGSGFDPRAFDRAAVNTVLAEFFTEEPPPVPALPAPAAQPGRVCARPDCGTRFTPAGRSGHQRYCSRSCRQRGYEHRAALARDPGDVEALTAAARRVRTSEVPAAEQAALRTAARELLDALDAAPRH